MSTVTADLGLAELCEREHPVLVGALGLYLGDRTEAEDIAQESLIRLVQHWPLDGVDNPAAWTMRVAFNLATSAFRRRAIQRRAIDRMSRHRTAPPNDTVEAVAVRRAVLDLPERQRRAVVLRYFADLSVRETAKVMRCPENTVKTLVHQAIKALRGAGLEVDADD